MLSYFNLIIIKFVIPQYSDSKSLHVVFEAATSVLVSNQLAYIREDIRFL